jgi:hypothetical protein
MIFQHRIHSNGVNQDDPFTSYLFSIFQTLWPSNTTKKTKIHGLQPRTAVAIAQVHTVTEPITFDYRDASNDDDDEYLSKSDSTLSSFGSSISSSSSNEEERMSQSSIALSEILCEHYVHQHTHEQPEMDVPLETFEALIEPEDEGWFVETPQHKRAIRSNSAHLRMVVAEVNMMRANKIICPLKPRGVLPARTDRFIPNSPSPLSASL